MPANGEGGSDRVRSAPSAIGISETERQARQENAAERRRFRVMMNRDGRMFVPSDFHDMCRPVSNRSPWMEVM